MSTYEIIGIIAGAASVVGMMWGAVWAVCKVMFMFGEYKGKQDALKEYSEENFKKLNTTFIAFSEKLDSMNKKIDTQNTLITKLETKVDNIEKKLDK
jgi:hypothetical protein